MPPKTTGTRVVADEPAPPIPPEGDFYGIPLTGPPNTYVQSGSGHGAYGYDAQGNLKIKKFPLQLAVIDGRMRSIFVPVPVSLAAPDFEPLDLSAYDIEPNTGIATLKGNPDAEPEYERVVYPVKKDRSDFRFGWTDNPATNPNAQYVVGINEDGDPIFAANAPITRLSSGTAAGTATQMDKLQLVKSLVDELIRDEDLRTQHATRTATAGAYEANRQ